MIDYDIESNGVQPYNGKRAFMYIFGDDDGNVVTLYPGKDDEEIQRWFDRAKVEGIRAWNSSFDRSFGELGGYDLPGDGLWYDGMVVAHAIDERRSVALKNVSSSLFGEQAADLQRQVHAWLTAERARRKKEAKENGTELIEPDYSDVPLEIMEPYGREDVILTRKVSEQYDPVIEANEDLKGVIEFERKVFDAKYAVEKRGLPVDRDGYAKLELEVVENLEAMEDRIEALAAEAGVEDFNPRSTPQVIAALKARGADLSYMSQKDGKLSADKENLEAVDDELAAAILEFRSEFKVLSTYVRPYIHRHYSTQLRAWKEAFVAPDGRIHATYRQIGARTGRMSCADPNIQNQPRDDLRLRYNVRAEPGMKLVGADLSNIEMRLFAVYAGEGALLDAVRQNKDIHTMTAEALGITDRERAGGYIETARQRGKTFNFSVIYGGGIRTIRRQQRCSQDHAKLLKRRYFDAYPEVKRLQNRIEYALHERGFIKTLWGRHRRVDPRDAYVAVNYLVQGTAAEILKDALSACHEEGLPVVALIHDEILCHCPADEAEHVKERLEFHMTRAARPGGKLWDAVAGEPIVPLEAEGEIMDRWSDSKNPDFEPRWSRELV